MNTQPPTPSLAVIVVAAGSGQRLGFGIPKAAVPLSGESILLHALRGVAAAGVARQICVALPAGDRQLADICATFAAELARSSAGVRGTAAHPAVTTVDGGATRQDSVQSALAGLLEGTEKVLVHDAARALTPASVFRRVVDALKAGAVAVIPAIPVVDTIKMVTPTEGSAATMAPEVVTGTAVRGQLRAVQTPQGFDVDTLLRAHATADDFDVETAASITDDAMLVEFLGLPVHVVVGSTQSLKITTPLDLVIAEGLLEGPLGARWSEG